MNLPPKRKIYWPLILTMGLAAAAIILTNYLNLATRIILPIIIISGLFIATLWLWAYANQKADGSEWWQDDDASGWRGY